MSRPRSAAVARRGCCRLGLVVAARGRRRRRRGTCSRRKPTTSRTRTSSSTSATAAGARHRPPRRAGRRRASSGRSTATRRPARALPAGAAARCGRPSAALDGPRRRAARVPARRWAARSLYLLKNNGALLRDRQARAGDVRWKRKLGEPRRLLPRLRRRRSVYAVLLARRAERGRPRGRLRRRDRQACAGRATLPSRAESSPLLDSGTLYFGTENGTVYALSARDGARPLDLPAPAAPSRAAWRSPTASSTSATTRARSTPIRARDGAQVWQTGTERRALRPRLGPASTRPPRSRSGASTSATPTAASTRSPPTSGALALAQDTGAYVYGSPAVADVAGLGPTVYIGSYDGTFYALNARTGDVRWSYAAGGKISGSATVVGDSSSSPT